MNADIVDGLHRAEEPCTPRRCRRPKVTSSCRLTTRRGHGSVPTSTEREAARDPVLRRWVTVIFTIGLGK